MQELRPTQLVRFWSSTLLEDGEALDAVEEVGQTIPTNLSFLLPDKVPILPEARR